MPQFRDKHQVKLTKIQKKGFKNATGIELAEDPDVYVDDDGDVWAEAWVRVKDIVFMHVDPDEIYAETDAVLAKYGQISQSRLRAAVAEFSWGPKEGQIEFSHNGHRGWVLGNGTVVTPWVNRAVPSDAETALRDIEAYCNKDREVAGLPPLATMKPVLKQTKIIAIRERISDLTCEYVDAIQEARSFGVLQRMKAAVVELRALDDQ